MHSLNLSQKAKKQVTCILQEQFSTRAVYRAVYTLSSGDRKPLGTESIKPHRYGPGNQDCHFKNDPHHSSPRVCSENPREGQVLKPKQAAELVKSFGGDGQFRGQCVPKVSVSEKLAGWGSKNRPPATQGEECLPL